MGQVLRTTMPCYFMLMTKGPKWECTLNTAYGLSLSQQPESWKNKEIQVECGWTQWGLIVSGMFYIVLDIWKDPEIRNNFPFIRLSLQSHTAVWGSFSSHLLSQVLTPKGPNWYRSPSNHVRTAYLWVHALDLHCPHLRPGDTELNPQIQYNFPKIKV